MTTFLIIACLVLFIVVMLQIGKVTDLAASLRGERETQLEANHFHAAFGMGFMVVFLSAVVASFVYYKDSMLGYGPNVPASEHGASIDFLFNVTMIITGIVFFLTHIFLFWFAWKYRETATSKAEFWHHNTMLEVVWMGIPAVAMTFLVVQGINTWNKAMADIPEDAVAGKDFIEVEATGMQYAWILRHPGKDNQLGEKYFTRIDPANNPVGQKWEDKRNHDDIVDLGELVLPVNKTIRVRITSRDVLHNFYLPQFRVKMDAVPGMPTYFVFKPTITTDSMRMMYSKHPDWQVASKIDDTKQRWQTFNFELACAELCGKGHYSMRKVVRIVSEKEYNEWLDKQESHYLTKIKGTSADPSNVKDATGAIQTGSTDKSLSMK